MKGRYFFYISDRIAFASDDRESAIEEHGRRLRENDWHGSISAVTDRVEKPPIAGPCSECGDREYSGNWHAKRRSLMDRTQTCFMCSLWLEMLWEDQHEPERAVIINHVHYRIGNSTPSPHPWSGFGGQEFVIVFRNPRRVVKTNNLWHQGKIPPHFRSRMPNNAIFAKNQNGAVKR